MFNFEKKGSGKSFRLVSCFYIFFDDGHHFKKYSNEILGKSNV